MLIFADPVKYDYAVRRIRVSNHDKEAKAYLHNMYRYDGVYKYACQMCHESCSSVEKAQLFNNPEAELDPMNLCLCPNCATVYKQLRYNDSLMDRFKGDILAIRQSEVSDGEQVVVPLDSHEIWFAQTHFAEIQELIKLSEQVKNGEKEYHLIEVMACRRGCIMGGGQPTRAGDRTKSLRAKGLYNADNTTIIKKSDENPLVVELYNGLLKGKEHHLLHNESY